MLLQSGIKNDPGVLQHACCTCLTWYHAALLVHDLGVRAAPTPCTQLDVPTTYSQYQGTSQVRLQP